MAFPNLVPTSRSFESGDYPVKAFRAQNGAETRILYKNQEMVTKVIQMKEKFVKVHRIMDSQLQTTILLLQY